MSCDDYIAILNKLMNVEKMVNTIRESSKAFNNSYMFKKGGPFNTMSFLKLKGCNKLSRSVSLGFKHKDFRVNPSKQGAFDVKLEPKSSS